MEPFASEQAWQAWSNVKLLARPSGDALTYRVKSKLWCNIFLGNLLSNCTKIMGLVPSPQNIKNKILDEIAKKLEIRKKKLRWNWQIVDENIIMNMWYVLMWYFLSNTWMNVEIWSIIVTCNITTLALHENCKTKTKTASMYSDKRKWILMWKFFIQTTIP